MPSTWVPVFMPLRKLHFCVLRNSRYPTSLQSCTLFCSFKLHGLPLSADLKAHWEFNLRLLGLRLLSLSCLALLSDLSLWHLLIFRHLLQDSSWRIFNPGLKIEDSPGLLLGNLQSRIEDWRFSRTLLGESSIQDWRLKILRGSCWGIFNPGLKVEDWRFSRTLVGESSIQDWRLKIEDSPGLFLENLQSRIEGWRLKILQDSCWGIFNPGLKIEDSPGLFLENLQSRREPFILNPQSWTEDSPRRVLGNLQSSILDWRFHSKSPRESSIFNLQSWMEDSPRRVLENLQSSILDWRFPNKSPGESSIFNPGLKILQEEPWRIFNLQSWIEDSQVWTQVWTSSLNFKSEHQVWISSLNIRSELHSSSNAMVCACQFQVFSLRCICI